MLPSDHVNVNFRNYMDNFTDIDDGLYIEDEELLSIVFNIISKNVVLRSILNMVDDRLGKKAKVSRFVYPRKTTKELWNTVWGKRITGCRDDISTGGVNPYSRVLAEFKADFRVPFTLFEEMVVECKEAHISTTGYKRQFNMGRRLVHNDFYFCFSETSCFFLTMMLFYFFATIFLLCYAICSYKWQETESN